MAARPRRPATRQRARVRRTPAGEPLLRGALPCACRAGRCASPRRLRRERAGGLALRVPVFASPSAESADLGLVLQHCFFGSLLAHWRRESVRAAPVGDDGVWRRRHAVFSHVCRSRGRHSAAARPEKSALFEHVFRSRGRHRAAAGLESTSKACPACAL
jgi:hypothetical protein